MQWEDTAKLYSESEENRSVFHNYHTWKLCTLDYL